MKRRVRKHKFPREKSNWFKKVNIFKILSIILIVLFILSIPTVIKKLVRITRIECSSQYGSCDAILADSLNISGNYKDVKKQINELLDKNVRVSSYTVQYKIPSILKVELNLIKPKYAIRDLSNNCYLIDKNGVVIEISKESNLPTLINNVTYSTGQKISDKDNFALQLIEKVSWVYSVPVGTIENGSLLIMLKEGILVRFPLVGDSDVLVGSLRLIFSRLNDESEGIRMNEIREIDLRFKNPILR